MKTAISIPDTTFARAEAAAARLGVPRSVSFTRAAERWLAQLATIDRADLGDRAGRLPAWVLSQVDDGLRRALDLAS